MEIDELKLIRGEDYIINDYITIHHPTLKEIAEFGEAKYWSIVYSICSTASDYMVELDQMGIDYSQTSDFQLFYIITRGLSKEDTSILFGNLDFQKLELGINTVNNNEVYFYVDENGNQIVIDEFIYFSIVEFIRKVHYIQKKKTVAANEHTKQYLLEKEKRRRKRHKNSKFESLLATSISALVNSEGFKYDYRTVWDLPIFLFFDAMRRISKIRNYTSTMTGLYSGSIDPKGINMEEINWASKIEI